MRVLVPVLVAVVATADVGVKTHVTALGASDPVSQPNPAAEPRMLGIHHLALKDGVRPEDFERFVAEEWSPVIRGRVPGIPIMVFKGERNAKGGDYLLVYDIQSQYVRDWYWPSDSTETEASAAVWEACGDPCNDVWDRLNSMAERTGWADYVELARH